MLQPLRVTVNEKTVIFPQSRISQRASYGTQASWSVTRYYSKKSFHGQMNLANTRTTYAVFFFFFLAFFRGYLNQNLQCTNFLRQYVFQNSFDPGTLYEEEYLWSLCPVEHAGGTLLQCSTNQLQSLDVNELIQGQLKRLQSNGLSWWLRR